MNQADGQAEMTGQALRVAYQQLNSGKSRKLVFHLTGRGFTSEINNLLLAVLYCLVHEIEFCLYARFWNAGYQNGWEDYFLPFCIQERRLSLYRRVTFSERLPEKLLYAVQKRLRSNELFSQDIWRRMRRQEFLTQEFVIPALGIRGDIFHAKQVMLRLLYQFNDEIEAQLSRHATMQQQLKPYIAVHIRRGDKVAPKTKEAMRIEAQEFIQVIRGLDSGITNLFLATDDYRAMQEFQAHAPADWRIASFCSPDKRGHETKRFNRMSGAEKKKETIRLLVDLEFLSQAEVFVGTYSSNVGRFVALARGGINCYSLNREWYAK